MSSNSGALAKKAEVALSVSLHVQVGQAGIRDQGSHSLLNSICARERLSANDFLSAINPKRTCILGMSTRVRQIAPTANHRASMCEYAKYAGMRTNAHRKKVAQGHP